MIRKLEQFTSVEKSRIVNDQFLNAFKGVIQNFQKLNVAAYVNNDHEFADMLIEFYENMDQLTIAEVSFGDDKGLKDICWKTVMTQNKKIQELKNWLAINK